MCTMQIFVNVNIGYTHVFVSLGIEIDDQIELHPSTD